VHIRTVYTYTCIRIHTYTLCVMRARARGSSTILDDSNTRSFASACGSGSLTNFDNTTVRILPSTRAGTWRGFLLLRATTLARRLRPSLRPHLSSFSSLSRLLPLFILNTRTPRVRSGGCPPPSSAAEYFPLSRREGERDERSCRRRFCHRTTVSRRRFSSGVLYVVVVSAIFRPAIFPSRLPICLPWQIPDYSFFFRFLSVHPIIRSSLDRLVAASLYLDTAPIAAARFAFTGQLVHSLAGQRNPPNDVRAAQHFRGCDFSRGADIFI